LGEDDIENLLGLLRNRTLFAYTIDLSQCLNGYSFICKRNGEIKEKVRKKAKKGLHLWPT